MAIETKALAAAFKRQPIPASCGIVVVVLLVFGYFRMGVVEEREAALLEAEKVLSKLTNNITYSAQLDQHLAELRAVNEGFAATALKQGDVARNQQFFYRIESASGVRILELRALSVPSPAKGAPVTFYQPLSYSLSVAGDYEKLLKFLRHLEQGATLGRVLSATLVHVEGPEQTLNLNVEMLGLK